MTTTEPASTDDDRPTAWAYEQACKALAKHRARADHAETQIAAVRQLLAAYGAGESTPERTIVQIAAVLAPTD